MRIFSSSFPVIDSGLGEVPRGEKMLYLGTDPESYITEYTLVYEDSQVLRNDGEVMRKVFRINQIKAQGPS